MKISDGFDARRLRPRSARSWRLRLGLLVGLLATLAGLLLLVVGGLSALGMEQELGPLAAGEQGGLAMLGVGLVLTWIGWAIWRRCSVRLRQPDGLSLAPHLFRKRG